MRRDINWKRPLESVFQIFRTGTHWIVRPNVYAVALVGKVIELIEISAVATSKSDVWIFRVRGNVSALATGHRGPISLSNSAARRSAINTNGTVILLCSVDSIGKLIIRDNLVELSRGIFIIG